MSAQVIPAQLSFLAIYNPALGPTDDTFRDQCVFWYSRAAQEARRKTGRNGEASAAAAREEENEKLRQIGLAQGMVDFARSFSDGEPVDSVETEKSRVVLREVENGWWILASIDLTRLPSFSNVQPESSVSKKGTEKDEPKPAIEYSSREVSPPALLIQQLLQAQHIFLLHHGSSLSELYVRLSRDKFCSTLDRFWNRFCRTWDVLLHGNPAVDAFSGMKLASGGELGMGVGEEDWGSGEREVLEDLVRRTEGLLDLVVSRFGEPATAESSDASTLPEHEALPWMGSGNHATAPDGVVFGGVGAITRSSLRNVSLWMRQIYTYGEYAYGVRDNPVRERRKRRRRNPPREPSPELNGDMNAAVDSQDIDPRDLRQKVQQSEAAKSQEGSDEPESVSKMLPTDTRPQMYGRTASQDHALGDARHTPELNTTDRPGIPPPIVKAADSALEQATKKADQGVEGRPIAQTDGSSTTMGIPDQYMKYLTFGLSELGRSSKPTRPPPPQQKASASSEATMRPKKQKAKETSKAALDVQAVDDAEADLAQLDPMPDGDDLKAKIALQKRQENRGHFVIGLKGNLDALPPADDGDEAADGTDGSFNTEAAGSRTVLRTLHIEVAPSPSEGTSSDDESLATILDRKAIKIDTEPDSISEAAKNVKRLRVLIYVHRPFIYCFLFENRTSSLSYGHLYRELHQKLIAIHRPLLSNTNAQKVAQRIEASHEVAETSSVKGTNTLPAKGGHEARPIYDLLYDPGRLTVHTSLPNIPEPGTLAAEGLGGGSAEWSRVEALNVHSAILNTLASGRRGELERTSKTKRGWWVVWMRVPPADMMTIGNRSDDDNDEEEEGDTDSAATLHPSQPHANRSPEQDLYRTAFLIRKSSDSTAGAEAQSRNGSRAASQGMWASTLAVLRPGGGGTSAGEEKTGGAGSGWGPAGSLTGGIGFDARAYVEGLMSLNR